jgi:hypothetical protein
MRPFGNWRTPAACKLSSCWRAACRRASFRPFGMVAAFISKGLEQLTRGEAASLSRGA